MQNNYFVYLIISIFLAFVINVHNAMEAPPQLTPQQVILVNGVYREDLWRNVWFEKIRDETDWLNVSLLFNHESEIGAIKKMKMIPKMMGCYYGLRFHQFLLLAVNVLRDFTYLSKQVNLYDTSLGCLDQLVNILQEGLKTALEVISSLTYIHSTVNDNRYLDAFYRSLLDIKIFFESSTVEDILAYEVNKDIKALGTFLQHTCRPDFNTAICEKITDEVDLRDGTFHDNEYYLKKMKYLVKHIIGHLTSLGFQYDSNTKLTIFNPSNLDHLLNVQSAMEAPPQPTPQQVILVNGVYREDLWRNVWFDEIGDETDWFNVSHLFNHESKIGTMEKMKMIPKMMGCYYGLRFHQFLLLAVNVLRDFTYLSNGENLYEIITICLDQLANILREGLETTLEVISSLKYIHYTANDNRYLDAFYRSLLDINKFFGSSTVEDILAYEVNKDIKAMGTYLKHTCKPDFNTAICEEITNEGDLRDGTYYDYEYYVKKMKYLVKHIIGHLTSLGFQYDSNTKLTIFNPINLDFSL